MDKVISMLFCSPISNIRIINSFKAAFLISNCMIFYPHISSYAVIVQIWLYIFIVQFISRVLVKFPICTVSGISYFGTPYLFRRLQIPRKCRNSVFSINRRINTVNRSRLTVHYSVGIYNKISYTVFFKEFILFRIICTFCKPYSFRVSVKIFPIIFFCHINLCIYSFRIIFHQW